MNRQAGNSPPTNDALFPSLTDCVRGGQCVAVIGAGVSGGDYPIWASLISQLQDRCGLRAEDLPSANPLDVAQVAKDKNPTAYYEALDKIFDRLPAPRSARRYHLLARINFLSYLTLNFDPLLVDTLDLHHNITVSDFPNLQAQNHGRREVFAVHGRLGPGRPAATTPVVLTRREFDEAYDPYRPLHSFILQTLISNDVCFLGCNPAESNLARILEACRMHCQSQHGLTSMSRPTWYLLADDGYEQLDVIEDCGIRVVHYPRRNPQFGGMDEVLEYWADKKSPFVRPAGVQGSRFNADVKPDR